MRRDIQPQLRRSAGAGRPHPSDVASDGSDGSENPDFVLNRMPFRHARILIAGANFGCGSSREHAPWALVDFGIRAIVAQDVHERLLHYASGEKAAAFKIDLAQQRTTVDGPYVVSFEIEPSRKPALLEGRDEIAHTLRFSPAIETWRRDRQQSAFPGARTPDEGLAELLLRV